MIFSLMLGVGLTAAGAAQAACYVDYKAKKDDPLRLHYGVAEIPEDACTPEAAAAELTRRLKADGWTLLSIVSLFDETGLSERQDRAGPNYLRY